jgi:hypothetical protein
LVSRKAFSPISLKPVLESPLARVKFAKLDANAPEASADWKVSILTQPLNKLPPIRSVLGLKINLLIAVQFSNALSPYVTRSE